MNHIYKITNKINNKCYIGLTTQGVNKRWSEHKYRFNLGERDHKLYLAMKKYGVKNFDIEILKTVKDKNKLSELEINYIKEFDSFNNGYNMTYGGDTVSDETRSKLSKIFKGREVTWSHKTVATRRKNGEWNHGVLFGAKNGRAKKYVVKHPDGRKEKIHGLREFCRKYNLSHNLMIATLNSKQNHHKGYVLSKFNDYDESQYIQANGSGECAVTLAA